MKRRDFIASVGAGLATPTLPGIGCSPAPGKLKKVGLQLYSVRGLMRDDFEGTLARVAEAGYDEVEFAGYYERTPREIKALLEKFGLTSPANHNSYDTLKEENLAKTIEAANIIGHKYLILPSLPRPQSREKPVPPGGQPPQGRQRLPEGQRQRPQEPAFTADQVKEIADIFNKIGESCHKAGLGFAYHNHRFEFQRVEDGDVMYDMMLKLTDPALVDYEIDLGWAVAAGADPLAYFQKYPGRFTLFHVKDMNEENVSVAVGKGKIDFPKIFARSELAGAKYYIVEYEGREEPMSSCADSVKYLKSITF